MDVSEIYSGNTATFTSVITGIDSLEGYSAYLIVKKSKNDSEENKKFEVSGTIEGMTLRFTIEASSNLLPSGDYWAEIFMVNGSIKMTIDQWIYRIKPSIKFK
jgi:hypothetical protein